MSPGHKEVLEECPGDCSRQLHLPWTCSRAAVRLIASNVVVIDHLQQKLRWLQPNQHQPTLYVEGAKRRGYCLPTSGAWSPTFCNSPWEGEGRSFQLLGPQLESKSGVQLQGTWVHSSKLIQKSIAFLRRKESPCTNEAHLATIQCECASKRRSPLRCNKMPFGGPRDYMLLEILPLPPCWKPSYQLSKCTTRWCSVALLKRCPSCRPSPDYQLQMTSFDVNGLLWCPQSNVWFCSPDSRVETRGFLSQKPQVERANMCFPLSTNTVGLKLRQPPVQRHKRATIANKNTCKLHHLVNLVFICTELS